MRLIFIIFLFIVLFLNPISYGQTSFSDHVSQLWMSGQKQEVLNIANKRLQQNPDDIVGLILKMEYEEEYVLLDDFKQTATRVLEIGRSIRTKNFSTIYPLLEEAINILLTAIPNYPPDQIESDKLKANINSKPMAYIDVIVALEKDGLVN